MRRIRRSFAELSALRRALVSGLSLVMAAGVLAMAMGGGASKGSDEETVTRLADAGRWIVAAGQPGIANAAPQDAGAVKRGKYLVIACGCNDCHTPLKMGPKGPEPDMSRMLSGHPAGVAMPAPPKLDHQWTWAGSGTMTAFVGPWGIDYATNLTPDEETGIGAWDAELFIAAIRNGKIMGGGRPILPPMPWQGYAQMTDDDLKAIFAYLQSVPAIKNQVPEYAPPPNAGGGGDH